MLNYLDLLCIPGFKVVHPEPEAVELDGEVDVFERGNEWEKEHQAIEFLQCLELLLVVIFASGEVKEEGDEVDDEWIPHQEEGHGRPQDMAALVQVI